MNFENVCCIWRAMDQPDFCFLLLSKALKRHAAQACIPSCPHYELLFITLRQLPSVAGSSVRSVLQKILDDLIVLIRTPHVGSPQTMAAWPIHDSTTPTSTRPELQLHRLDYRPPLQTRQLPQDVVESTYANDHLPGQTGRHSREPVNKRRANLEPSARHFGRMERISSTVLGSTC